MSMLYLKSGAAGFALLGALFVTPPASAQIVDVTGQVGGAVDVAAQTTTDAQSRTQLEKEVEFPETNSDIEVESETDISAQTDTELDGNAVREDMRRTMTEGQTRLQPTGDAALRTTTRSETNIGVNAPSSALDGMLTVGTPVMTSSGDKLGMISGLETTETGIIRAVRIEGQANDVPVSALSAEDGVLVSSMTKADIN